MLVAALVLGVLAVSEATAGLLGWAIAVTFTVVAVVALVQQFVLGLG